MLLVALGLTIISGYRDAYFGPFYVVQLHQAGYSTTQIAQIFRLIQIVNVLLIPLWIVIPVLVCYHFGKRYRLTLTSTIIFAVTMYAICTVGKITGYVAYQIQTPDYPVFWSMLRQAFSVTDTFTWSLVGVLAGNYRREVEQKKSIVTNSKLGDSQ
jgi:hypothetical protein